MTHHIVSCLIALTFVFSATSPLWAAQPLQAGDGSAHTALAELPASGQYGVALDGSRQDLQIGASAAGQRVAIAESSNSSVEQAAISSSSPGARWASGFAYDSTAAHLVLFGGIVGGGGYLNDQWTYDATGWHAVTLAVRPSARAVSGNSMAYDEVRHRMVLFGGSTTCIWVIHGNSTEPTGPKYFQSTHPWPESPVPWSTIVREGGCCSSAGW